MPFLWASPACHATTIKPEVAARIDQRYPKVQAREYDFGQLRGAFTLRRTLDSPIEYLRVKPA